MQTLENLEQSFCKFMALTPQDGTVIVYGDDKRLLELAQSTGRRILSYGFDKGCDFVCTPCATLMRQEQLKAECNPRFCRSF